jgi:FkbM family methyltransferase
LRPPARLSILPSRAPRHPGIPLDHLPLLDNPPLRIKPCRRGVMMYLTTDVYIGRSLDLYGEFSEGEIALFAQLVKPGMTVLDVGANIGAHTVFFATAAGDDGLVIAFEPQRAVYHMLCGNIALNGLGNVAAHHAALGRTLGSIAVPPLDYTRSNNFGGVSLGTAASGYPVPLVTIDSLALPQCDLIKVDVEGMEHDVLRGAAATIARFQPVLYVENDREEKSAALIALLFELGYRLHWHVTPLFNPKNYAGNTRDIFGGTLSTNMLGLPRSIVVPMTGFKEITAPTDTWHSVRGA